MSRSSIGWALGVVAPWCLGIGLVISFTAQAGQDLSSGASLANRVALAPATPLDLMPASRSSLSGLPGANAMFQRASFEMLDPAGARPVVNDETPPRIALKRNQQGWPSADRSHKGDPVVGLRPSFDAKLRLPGGLAAMRANELMLGSENYLAFVGFAPVDSVSPGFDMGQTLTPDDEPATLEDQSPGSASPRGQAGGMVAAGQSPGVFDGATPHVPRAVGLASMTPAGPDQTPVEVVVIAGLPQLASAPAARAPLAAPNATIVERNGARPDYASLIDQDRAASEERCLAEAVYFEARSEPEDGQAAVAQVVLNRVKSGLYPSTICGVVYQNRQHHNACQFSFACEGKALRVTEPGPWKTASRIAHDVLQGETYLADVGGATHYHTNYVRPRWAKALKKMDVIGHHIFYALRPGQT